MERTKNKFLGAPCQDCAQLARRVLYNMVSTSNFFGRVPEETRDLHTIQETEYQPVHELKVSRLFVFLADSG